MVPNYSENYINSLKFKRRRYRYKRSHYFNLGKNLQQTVHIVLIPYVKLDTGKVIHNRIFKKLDADISYTIFG